MNIISKIVDWCLEEKKPIKNSNKVYIPCSSYFLSPNKSQSSQNEMEKFLDEIFASN